MGGHIIGDSDDMDRLHEEQRLYDELHEEDDVSKLDKEMQLQQKIKALRGGVDLPDVAALLSRLEVDQAREEDRRSFWRGVGTGLGIISVICAQVVLVLLGMKLGMSFEWAALLTVLLTINVAWVRIMFAVNNG